ncbi:MAG: helix-turn-helix domain-containing protein [Coriobacteriia bacterium]|nr:helix-turn-helix domain-containing protein [Coriobacteriia bacterium]
MKLRTVLNELACTDFRVGKEKLLNEDVLFSLDEDAGIPHGARLLRMAQLSDFQEGAGSSAGRHIALVLAGHEIPEGLRVGGDFVVVASDLAPDAFRSAFLALPAKAALLELRRDRMFDAFLSSYDLSEFAERSAAVLGNPLIISNADGRLLAAAGKFPADAPDVQEVLERGYLSEDGPADEAAEQAPGAVRQTRHSIVGTTERFGRSWATAVIRFHRLEMGRYDVLEKDGPISGFDLELVDYASLLAGVMIDRLGAAGERVGSGSSVLHDLVEGSYLNEQTMRAQLRLMNVPVDVAYVLAVVAGRGEAGRDFYARVGSMSARALHNGLWCAREDCLVALVPIGKNESAGYDDYARAQRRILSNKAFSAMLATNELSAFVSEPFDNLTMSPGRFKEAMDLTQTVRDPAAGKAYFFWEHRFAALASISSSPDKLEMLLDKRVVAMADYDREHGTAYLQTAMMSVRYPGSPADAAAALNVHRNTYFYRMNKVRELFFIDLKDGDDRLALSFSASIMEGMAK